MFGNKKQDGPKMPSMGVLMAKLGPLVMGTGDKRKVISDLIMEFATTENLAYMSAALIAGLKNLQERTGERYLLTVEMYSDNSDIGIGIWVRNENGSTSPYKGFLLSQITQDDIISLVNLIFDGANATNTQPAALPAATPEQH